MDNTADQRPPLTPDARKRGEPRGTAVRAGDDEWDLPDAPTDRGLDRFRDRMYDELVRRGTVTMTDVRAAAVCLIRQNYDLTIAEAIQVLARCEQGQLAEAVAGSLLGPTDKARRTTYSMWVRAVLIANRIEPAAVEPDQVHNVIDLLIATGRAVKPNDYCDMGRAMRDRAAALRAAEW